MAVGEATVTLALTHQEGFEITRSYALRVRPAQPPVTRRSVETLAAASGSLCKLAVATSLTLP